MKQKLLLLLVAWLPISAFCDNVKVGKLWYELGHDFTATVIRSADNEYSGDIVIPESIKIRQGDNETEYTVTTIKINAFINCESLTSVVIPNSIIEIEGGSIGGLFSGAFSGCSNLTSVSFGNNVKTIGSFSFYHCTNLTSITIPNSVETIGGRAFSSCGKLNSVSIGNGIKEIGDYAFADCGLSKVNITDIAAWCKIQFGHDITSVS